MAEKKKRGNVIQEIRELARPLAENLGLRLWDVRIQKEGANLYLRIFIDNDSGITLDDCVNMHHAIDAPLDELDPIEESYSLQVSSPGIERELILDEHFLSYIGSKVILKLHKAIDGQKEIFGVLENYENDEITVLLENEIASFNKKDLVFVKLDDFEGF